MKKILAGTALVSFLILVNSTAAVYSKPPVSLNVDNAIAQVDEIVEIPAPVSEGLEFYKAGKVEMAVNKWVDSILAFIKDLPVESAQGTAKKEEAITMFNQYRPTLIIMLNALNQQYGACKGYKVIKSIKRENNTQSIYLDILHKKGSVFMEFVTLKTPQGWRIVHFHFSPDIEEIFR